MKLECFDHLDFQVPCPHSQIVEWNRFQHHLGEVHHQYVTAGAGLVIPVIGLVLALIWAMRSHERVVLVFWSLVLFGAWEVSNWGLSHDLGVTITLFAFCQVGFFVIVAGAATLIETHDDCRRARSERRSMKGRLGSK